MDHMECSEHLCDHFLEIECEFSCTPVQEDCNLPYMCNMVGCYERFDSKIDRQQHHKRNDIKEESRYQNIIRMSDEEIVLMIHVREAAEGLTNEFTRWGDIGERYYDKISLLKNAVDKLYEYHLKSTMTSQIN